jgi:hypothetical protein
MAPVPPDEGAVAGACFVGAAELLDEGLGVVGVLLGDDFGSGVDEVGDGVDVVVGCEPWELVGAGVGVPATAGTA